MAKLPAFNDFLLFFWKKICFNAIGSQFARVQSHLKELDLKPIEKTKLIIQFFFHLQFVPNTLKILHFCVKF